MASAHGVDTIRDQIDLSACTRLMRKVWWCRPSARMRLAVNGDADQAGDHVR
jgi:hypothetical protein